MKVYVYHNGSIEENEVREVLKYKIVYAEEDRQGYLG